MDEEFESLRSSIARLGTVDLAAGIGGLQLLPANAERQLRFERAAALIYSTPPIEGPPLSAGRWRSMMNTNPIARSHVITAEDPAEHIFSDSVSFIGGSYIVFRGIVDESAETARLLLQAVHHSTTSLPRAYAEEMQALAYAVLRLSHAVAGRIGLGRNAPPGREEHGRVYVPPAALWASLKAAVSFSRADLERITDPIPVFTLEPLIGVPGTVDLNPEDEDDLTYAYIKPIVHHDGAYVVLIPSGLLVALRHRILSRAKSLGQGDALAKAFRSCAAERAARSLRWMGWHRQPWSIRDAPTWGVESFWSFDVDKLAHVLLVADDLGEYDEADPFGPRDLALSDPIADRIVQVQDRVQTGLGPAPSVLHLIVLQGVGRGLPVGLPARAGGSTSDPLLVSQPDLAVMARCEVGEPLALWKFAQAGTRLRESAAVLAWSALDEYGAYRGARHSFYLSDHGRADVITLPTDLGAALRLEDSQRFDFHGVPRWDGRGIMEVQRRFDRGSIPIYAPDPGLMERVEFLVEDQPLPIWVHQAMDTDEPEQRALYFELCETVAYWLWQAADLVTPIMDRLATACELVRIAVVVEDPTRWGTWDGDLDGTDWLESRASPTGVLDLAFLPAAQAALSGPDNSGERQLLRCLIDGLVTMAANASGAAEVSADDLVDRCAPLGQKKKLMFLDTGSNLELLPVQSSALRLIQDADVEDALDLAGPAVARRLGLSTGPVPDDQRSAVLNTVVDIYADEVVRTIASLDAEALVEKLVDRHEAVTQALAAQRLTMSTQPACFGSEPDYVSEIHARVDALTKTDIALRFLIEAVVAQPPTGHEPLSLSTYDRLLALCHEVINKGTLSDAVYYKLGDVALSVLPSGRLGIDREGRYVTGIEAFRPVKAAHDMLVAERFFESHWPSHEPVERPASVDDLDEATNAEFGLTMTEIAGMIGELLALRLEGSTAPTRLSRDTVVSKVAGKSSTPPEKVEKGLDLLSLRPRPTFLPSGRPADAYPWRFNRDLSYVRRPLLVLEEPDGEKLIWGVRHLSRVGPNLLHLIHSGRLKATSGPMQQYIGRMRTEAAQHFNDEVAILYESRADLVVGRRVDKIGSLRIERSPAEPLGDVDVLVVDPREHLILAVETKDLEQARTPAEMSHQLRSLFEGDDSAVGHLRERVQWLRRHTAEVLKAHGLHNAARRWQVRGLIVVSRPLVTPFMADSPFEVAPFEALRTRLG